MILAGYETTANTLAYSLYLLGKHPHARQRPLQEVDQFQGRPGYDSLHHFPYAAAVINETLRLHPAAAIMNREATENVQVMPPSCPPCAISSCVVSFLGLFALFLLCYTDSQAISVCAALFAKANLRCVVVTDSQTALFAIQYLHYCMLTDMQLDLFALPCVCRPMLLVHSTSPVCATLFADTSCCTAIQLGLFALSCAVLSFS